MWRAARTQQYQSFQKKEANIYSAANITLQKHSMQAASSPTLLALPSILSLVQLQVLLSRMQVSIFSDPGKSNIYATGD